ncbi:MAG: hypothetical protein H0X26_10355 [Alphaproteobacteria bacterium]|nr:hypothetical protein [Alphaproteobacteria bacterium]
MGLSLTSERAFSSNWRCYCVYPYTDMRGDDYKCWDHGDTFSRDACINFANVAGEYTLPDNNGNAIVFCEFPPEGKTVEGQKAAAVGKCNAYVKECNDKMHTNTKCTPPTY